jgi:ferredoxin
MLGSQRCLKCGQCGEVCARSLELVEAWDELEQMVKKRLEDPEAFGETIRAFADLVDAQEDAVLGVALP